MPTLKRKWLYGFILVCLLSVFAVSAQDTILSNNTGTGSTPWQIQGEPSLIINGFDLNAQGITLPVDLESITIDVAVPVAGQTISAVVYQDANGGSPVDATLLRREQTSIASSGVFTYQFATPVTISQPVLWVGFYLPVGFEFRADTSGSSVLTYWAWEPGTTFDLSSLANADVLGPADGTAPVNLDMGGIARITALLNTDGTITTPDPNLDDDDTASPTIRQRTGGTVSLAPMVPYGDDCAGVYFDQQDITITYSNSVRFFCKEEATPAFAPETPEGYFRRGPLFDVFAFGLVSPGTNAMPNPVTHCLRPPASDLPTAVIGLAYGSPREWEILPTVRYGDVICAEFFYTGNVSYFVPSN